MRSTSRDDVVDRHAPARAARRRNDAVGAALLAAGLHAQRERRPPGDARARSRRRTARRRRRTVRPSARPASANASSTRRSLSSLRTTRTTFGSAATSSGAARRVAAGHDDLRGGIVARDAADRLPGALIGGRGHRAGVDDDHVRVGRRRVDPAARAQVLFDAQRVRLVHAAAEGDDGVLHGRAPSTAASLLARPPRPSPRASSCSRSSRAAIAGSPTARICAASTPALVAPGLPIDTVATGTPGGIWTVDSSASSPFSADESIGTPITGSVVCAATTPARCAAAPAPTMKTLTPRPGASRDEPHHALGRAVRGRDGHLARDSELAQDIDGRLHDRRIGVRTHQDQNSDD